MVLTTESAIADKPEPSRRRPRPAATATGTGTDRHTPRRPRAEPHRAGPTGRPPLVSSASRGVERRSWTGSAIFRVRRGPRMIVSRSDSDRPPQMPYGSCASSACSRHCAITGHSGRPAWRGLHGGPGPARAHPRDGRRSRCPSPGRLPASASPRCRRPGREASGCPPCSSPAFSTRTRWHRLPPGRGRQTSNDPRVADQGAVVHPTALRDRSFGHLVVAEAA